MTNRQKFAKKVEKDLNKMKEQLVDIEIKKADLMYQLIRTRDRLGLLNQKQ